MKTEKKQNNSMKLEKVRLILSHLKNISNCEELMKTIEIYENKITQYPCKKITKPDHYIFYEITGKNEKGQEIPGDNLGKLSKDLYKLNTIKIEVLRLLGLKNELKQLIEQLKIEKEKV